MERERSKTTGLEKEEKKDNKRRQTASLPKWLKQMILEVGWNRPPGPWSWSPVWVTAAKALWTFTAFPVALAGTWVRSRISGIQTSTLIRNANSNNICLNLLCHNLAPFDVFSEYGIYYVFFLLVEKNSFSKDLSSSSKKSKESVLCAFLNVWIIDLMLEGETMPQLFGSSSFISHSHNLLGIFLLWQNALAARTQGKYIFRLCTWNQ